MVASLATPATSLLSPLHEVSEQCPYPLSLSTAQANVQHELSLQSSAA